MQVQEQDTQTFVRQSRDQLREWRKWLAGMKLEVGRKADDARTRLQREIEDLSVERDALERRLHAASKEAQDGWSEVMDDLQEAMRDFSGTASRTYHLVMK